MVMESMAMELRGARASVWTVSEWQHNQGRNGRDVGI